MLVATGAESDVSVTEHLEALWAHAGNVPIGRLGITFDHYVHCARAMRAAGRTKNVDAVRRAAVDYLDRASEVLRRASHDRFHWLRLQSSLLPAEPEAVAVMVALAAVARKV